MMGLLKYWRQIVLILAVSGAYLAGRVHEGRACKADLLQAQIQSLQDQLEMNRKVQEAAVFRSAIREQEKEVLAAKVEDYESELESRAEPSCILSAGDAERLHTIR